MGTQNKDGHILRVQVGGCRCIQGVHSDVESPEAGNGMGGHLYKSLPPPPPTAPSMFVIIPGQQACSTEPTEPSSLTCIDIFHRL